MSIKHAIEALVNERRDFDEDEAAEAIRYHSLAIQKEGFPENELEISAWSDSGVIMGVRHRHYPIEGVQFHPESILTGEGKHLLKNFLEM